MGGGGWEVEGGWGGRKEEGGAKQAVGRLFLRSVMSFLQVGIVDSL